MAHPARAAATSQKPAPGGALRVLLVAERADAAPPLLRELRAGGYAPQHERVDTAAALSAALDRGDWDVVIVDDALSHVSVAGVLALAREQAPDVPVIVVAESAEAEQVVAAMRAGARDYLPKSNLARLASAIDRERQVGAGRRPPPEDGHRRPADQGPHAARAEALVRLSTRLSAQLDLAAIVQIVCEETARALDVPIAGVSLLDRRSGTMHHAADIGLAPEHRPQAHLIARSFATQSIQRIGQLMLIPDVTAANVAGKDFVTAVGIRTLVGARLLREEQRVGLLYVATRGRVRHFSEDELDLLTGLANQAMQAIINARLLEEAQRRLAYFQALHTIDMATNSTLDLRVIFSVVLDHIVAQLKVDAAAVLLLNQHWQMLEHASGRGFQATGLNRYRIRLNEDPAGRAALERRLVTIPNLAEADEPFARLDQFAEERFVAYYALPLIAKGQVKGVLELFHRAPLDPNTEWLSFLEALAAQAALAIDNATLFNSLERSNVELTLAYDATIEGWSRALELRDTETEGHTMRVAELTLQLARAAGMSEAELVHVRRGALLHDIGKMGIPDQILLKDGPLTDAEREVMRKHPVYAYEMLSPVRFLRPALDIPYCHHEKWDGSGYPRGLKGEQIPLAARIFAIVDVWDALRSNRPYRAAWPVERVLEHIRAETGRHFDPALVRVFLEMTRPSAAE